MSRPNPDVVIINLLCKLQLPGVLVIHRPLSWREDNEGRRQLLRISCTYWQNRFVDTDCRDTGHKIVHKILEQNTCTFIKCIIWYVHSPAPTFVITTETKQFVQLNR